MKQLTPRWERGCTDGRLLESNLGSNERGSRRWRGRASWCWRRFLAVVDLDIVLPITTVTTVSTGTTSTTWFLTTPEIKLDIFLLFNR